MCVLDNADMNKHGQRRHDNDSIKRRSSVRKKQILFKKKKTHSYESNCGQKKWTNVLKQTM